ARLPPRSMNASGTPRLEDGRPAARPSLRRLRLLELHDDHRHVIVGLGVANERAHFADDALADSRRVERVMARHDARESGVAEELSVDVRRLRDAVRVQNEHVARPDRAGVLLEHLTEALSRAG